MEPKNRREREQGSPHMGVKSQTNWPKVFLCVHCSSIRENDDKIAIRSVVSQKGFSGGSKSPSLKKKVQWFPIILIGKNCIIWLRCAGDLSRVYPASRPLNGGIGSSRPLRAKTGKKQEQKMDGRTDGWMDYKTHPNDPD